MRQLLHEFLLLCGSKGKRVKQSVFFGFFDGIFEAMPFCAVFYLFYHLEQLSWNASFLTLSDAGIVAAIFLVGVIGRWIMKFCIYRFQSVASYEAIADARLAVGDHLKQAPMGFFNSETIGNTVTTLTDDMHYIEQNAANILEKTINGCINVFVMTLGVFVFDWRLGLIFLMGAILSLAIISSMQKAGISVAAKAKENIYKIAIAAVELSKTKTGALIVLERDIKLKDIIETGVLIGAEISPQLLVNIFQACCNLSLKNPNIFTSLLMINIDIKLHFDFFLFECVFIGFISYISIHHCCDRVYLSIISFLKQLSITISIL